MTRTGLLALAAGALLLATTVRVLAQAGTAFVHPDPLSFEVGNGQEETLSIVMEDAQGVYGIDVRASFDPSAIEILDDDPSKDGVQMTPGSFIKPDFVVRNIADNQNGTLQYVVTQVNPSPPANGRGVILTLRVRGKALGKKTALTIDSVQIADRTGQRLAVRQQAGTVTVVQPKPSTPTPVPSPTAIVPVTPTPVPAAAAAATVVAIAQPTALPASVNPPAVNSGDSSSTTLTLAAVAGGGFFGALLLLGFAVWLIRRPPKQSK